VASNKVGHFIYGLKDRIWPDFVCHFSLFHGTHPRISGFYHDSDYSWSSADQNIVVAQRSPTKLHANLSFLKKSALSKDSSHSTLELAKFGFDRAQILGSHVPPAPLQNLKSNRNRL
jgi:hypothetical protein